MRPAFAVAAVAAAASVLCLTALSPVVMSVVGSSIAHTDFTYGDGSLWLYGYQMLAGPQVVRI
ncbi:MAG: hypothetical protein ABSG39_14640, partial [Acidimicrobiales bacterium]